MGEYNLSALYGGALLLVGKAADGRCGGPEGLGPAQIAGIYTNLTTWCVSPLAPAAFPFVHPDEWRQLLPARPSTPLPTSERSRMGLVSASRASP